MKKALVFIFILAVLSLAAVAVIFERFPESEAAKFIDPWCRSYYMEIRNRVIKADKEKVKRPSIERKNAHVVSSASSPKVFKEVPTNKIERVEVERPLLKDAKWYTNRRVGMKDIKENTVICCVWNINDATSFELLKNAQRIADGFRGKKLVVFASHRGGESALVKKFLKKEDITIPCCEGAGHSNEPKGVKNGSVLYMIDKSGKLKYYGRNDKALIVKLVDILSGAK